MARYGRDYGTWNRGTYDLDYNAGYGGLENERGGPWGRGWANYYTAGGYGPRTGAPRTRGGYGRDYGIRGGGGPYEAYGQGRMGVTFNRGRTPRQGYVGGRGMYDTLGGNRGLARNRPRYGGTEA